MAGSKELKKKSSKKSHKKKSSKKLHKKSSKTPHKKSSKKSHKKKSSKKPSHVKSSPKKKSHKKKQKVMQNPKQMLKGGPTVATSTQMNPSIPNPPAPNPPAPYYMNQAPVAPQYGNAYQPAAPYAPQYGTAYPPAAPYAPAYSAPYSAPVTFAPNSLPVAAPVVMAPPPPRELVNPNCPPGLEYLTQVDQLVVVQEVDMLQVFTGYESHNRYSVKNAANQNVYYCVETSDVLTMNLMHSDRPFEIIILDNFGNLVLRATRPYRFGSVLCGCPDLLQVSTGNGQHLGTVQEQFKFCGSRFTVHDANGEIVLFLEGPPCRCDFIDTEFEVLTDDETKVGAVTRHFPGFFKEMFTHSNIFGVSFPIDLQAEIKAVLLASTFLIDFMYYQQKDGEQEGAFGGRSSGGGGGSNDNWNDSNDRRRSSSPRRSVSRPSPDMDMGLGGSIDMDMGM